MDDNKRSIKDAQSFYDNEKYDKAIEICMDLIESNESMYEAALLLAKSDIMYFDPLKEQEQNNILNACKLAFSNASTFDELVSAEREIGQTIYLRHLSYRKEALDWLERNPTLANAKSYIPIDVGFSKLNLYAHILVSKETRDELAKKSGYESSKEAYANYTGPESGSFDEDTMSQWEYEAGCRVFDAAKENLEENSDGTPQFVQAMMKSNYEKMLLASWLVKYGIPKADAGKDEKRLERLQKKAEIDAYCLNAKLYPNGQPCSMMIGDRSKQIDELKEIYNEISKLDPEFVMPELPPVIGEGPRNTSASGGCYVATAVYGSYNCPQVWTLRRFRDYTLADSWYGRAFIHFYYAISPTIVKWFGHTKWFNEMWRPVLDDLVRKLNENGFSDTPYEDKQW